MINKRPFVDEDSSEFTCKFPRQLDHNHIDEPASIVRLDNGHQMRSTSDGQGEDCFSGCHIIEKLASGLDVGVSNGSGKDLETVATGCFPHFLWINNGILEADNQSLFPEYFDHGHQLRARLQPDEVFSSLDYPCQKPVCIGPEHQAEVPDWHPRDLVASLNQLENSDPQTAVAQSWSSGGIVNDGYEQNLMGTCVMRMPQVEESGSCCSVRTCTECRCIDVGSIRCVRQHVTEAREKLKDSLGDEVFAELGFCDMGEDVAKKWTEDEGQMFDEVVASNPPSLGTNFWDHLSASFPTRSKKEIVSYYFNVFMLQKRAEQNRFDPLNIDSDNDEWQKSEDGTVNEDDDSVVESLTGQDALTDHLEDHVVDQNVYVEDENEFVASRNGGDNVVRRVATYEEYEGDVEDSSGLHFLISNGNCGVGSECELFDGACKNRDDYDAQDDSCTSFEDQQDHSCGPLDRGAEERVSNPIKGDLTTRMM